MTTLEDIKHICPSDEWESIRVEIEHYTSDALDALEGFLLAGINAKESCRLVDFAIDLSILTTLTPKLAACQICMILNKFNGWI